MPHLKDRVPHYEKFTFANFCHPPVSELAANDKSFDGSSLNQTLCQENKLFPDCRCVFLSV